MHWDRQQANHLKTSHGYRVAAEDLPPSLTFPFSAALMEVLSPSLPLPVVKNLTHDSYLSQAFDAAPSRFVPALEAALSVIPLPGFFPCLRAT